MSSRSSSRSSYSSRSASPKQAKKKNTTQKPVKVKAAVKSVTKQNASKIQTGKGSSVLPGRQVSDTTLKKAVESTKTKKKE
jgi:hypothetical protein